MWTWIVSDSPATGEPLRLILSRHAHECPSENLLSFEQAPAVIASRPDVNSSVVVLLGRGGSATLQSLARLRGATKSLIVVVGPKDAGLILDAVRAGADDYVDEALVEQELPRSISRQMATRGVAAPEGEVIVVMAGSGGCGRSQIATNLAVTLAKLQGRTALIDLDVCGGNCASMLNLKPRHTILELSRHTENLDRKTLERTLIAHESGVHLLAAPNDLVRLDSIAGDLVERLIREARLMFPSVVLDFQNHAAGEQIKKLVALNARLLLVTRLDFNSACNTGRVLHYLERMKVDRRQIQVIANRHGQPGDVPVKKIEQTLSIRIPHLLPDDPRTVQRSINNGIPYVLESPLTPLSKALSVLAESFVKGPSTVTSSPYSTASALEETQNGWPHFLNFRSVLSRFA